MDQNDELTLATKLLENGMAVLIPREAVACGPDGRLIRSGFFVVATRRVLTD